MLIEERVVEAVDAADSELSCIVRFAIPLLRDHPVDLASVEEEISYARYIILRTCDNNYMRQSRRCLKGSRLVTRGGGMTVYLVFNSGWN